MFNELKTKVSNFVKNPEVKNVVKTLAIEAAVIVTVAAVSWAAYYAINGPEATEVAWKHATHQDVVEETSTEETV